MKFSVKLNIVRFDVKGTNEFLQDYLNRNRRISTKQLYSTIICSLTDITCRYLNIQKLMRLGKACQTKQCQNVTTSLFSQVKKGFTYLGLCFCLGRRTKSLHSSLLQKLVLQGSLDYLIDVGYEITALGGHILWS